MKLTREMLKNYKKMKLDFEMLEKERQYFYDTYRTPAFKTEVSGIKGSSSPVERVMAKLQSFDEKRGKLIMDMMEIEDHVDAVEDQKIRSILKLRYIFCYSWKATASIMNMSEIYVRTCERQFFDENEYI